MDDGPVNDLAVVPLIGGVVIVLCILALLIYGQAERRGYWAARGAVVRAAQAPGEVPTTQPGVWHGR